MGLHFTRRSKLCSGLYSKPMQLNSNWRRSKLFIKVSNDFTGNAKTMKLSVTVTTIASKDSPT